VFVFEVAAYRASGAPCGPAELAEVRAEAISDWQGMTNLERQEWQSRHPSAPVEDADDEAETDAAPPHDARTPWERELADGTGWPVGFGHLDALLGTVSNNSGVTRRLAALRPELLQRCLVRNSGDIPDGNIEIPTTCHEAHFGLCCSRDAAVFDASQSLAASLRHPVVTT
jgi:hypothetical protein